MLSGADLHDNYFSRQKVVPPVDDRGYTLAGRFFIVGSIFSLCAMVLVGVLVTKLIEEIVTRNAASSTALYVDSIIAPLLPDMAKAEKLDEVSSRALDETLSQGALRRRLLAFRIWGSDGKILYSNDNGRVARQHVAPGDGLKAALAGHLVAQFEPEMSFFSQHQSDLPLLEIYSPVLQPWSGEVVAVTEFYERAEELQSDLFRARLQSLTAVAGVTVLFFLGLSTIVVRGSRTITQQSVELRRRIDELSLLLAQNTALKARIQRASAATTTLNERYMRQLGADLHDGPAQLIALAALRLDGGALFDPNTPAQRRNKELNIITSSLDEALREIRDICTGHVLPHVEAAGMTEILLDLVSSYKERTGHPVELRCMAGPEGLPTAAKICIYRFVQEALNNGLKHAGGKGQWLSVNGDASFVSVRVGDEGSGISPEAARDKGIGLRGMRDRVESLGGRFSVASDSTGTVVTMTLYLEEMEKYE